MRVPCLTLSNVQKYNQAFGSPIPEDWHMYGNGESSRENDFFQQQAAQEAKKSKETDIQNGLRRLVSSLSCLGKKGTNSENKILGHVQAFLESVPRETSVDEVKRALERLHR